MAIRTRRHLLRLLCTALVLGTAPVLAATPAAAEIPGIPSVGTRFADAGPYPVTVQREFTHTYYSPRTLGANGARHPVILWGNGTGGNPGLHDGLLRHLASHGFVVAAANTPNAGTGRDMLAGLDNVTRFASTPGNRFYQVVDVTRVGSTGHSQGGGGALQTGADPRVDTVFPLQPWLGNPAAVRGPALLFAGEWDTLVPPAQVRAAYRRVPGPAAYAELDRATHFTPGGNAGGYRFPLTAWARWHLMEDAEGRAQFVGPNCGLCTSSAWRYEVNAAFPTG
jgi:fermentation-respiration switch protein FrsA (DUF1100 family)